MRDAEWLGRWEGPFYETEMVPAVNAAGYKYMPYPVAVVRTAEKADFSRGPQMDWWMDKKEPRKLGARVSGAKQVLRSINKFILQHNRG